MLNLWYWINIIAVLLLILAVLLQQTSSGVLGGGATSNIQSILSKRGAAGFISKVISVFAVVYFLSAVILSFLYSREFSEVDVLIQDAIDELLMENVSKPVVDDSLVDSVPVINKDIDQTTTSDQIVNNLVNDLDTHDDNVVND